MDDATKMLLARVVERLQEHERQLHTVELLAGPMNFDTQGHPPGA
jgi:hypothetical protein